MAEHEENEILEEENPHRGTMVITMLFLLFCAVLWALVYFLLISRSGG